MVTTPRSGSGRHDTPPASAASSARGAVEWAEAVRDAHKAIEFYKKAFRAVEMFGLDGPDGRVGECSACTDETYSVVGPGQQPCAVGVSACVHGSSAV